jgi:hypothetical protein
LEFPPAFATWCVRRCNAYLCTARASSPWAWRARQTRRSHGIGASCSELARALRSPPFGFRAPPVRRRRILGGVRVIHVPHVRLLRCLGLAVVALGNQYRTKRSSAGCSCWPCGISTSLQDRLCYVLALLADSEVFKVLLCHTSNAFVVSLRCCTQLVVSFPVLHLAFVCSGS